MRKIPSVTDYFVITSGTSTTQVGAIADNIEEELKGKGERLWHIEGEREALWILLDYGDVIVHVFTDQMRKFYELEKLWGDVPKEKFRELRIKKVRVVKKKRVVKKIKKSPRGKRKPHK
jgi:ribosome-associated protein